MVLDKRPEICPLCGELVIVWVHAERQTALYPDHPDNVTPWVLCEASARVLRAGKIVAR